MNTLTGQKRMEFVVRRTIIESVQEIFADPDFGLKLSAQTVKQLKKAQKVNPKKLISLADFRKKCA